MMVMPAALQMPMIRSQVSGFIGRLLNDWLDIGHDGKFIGAPILDFDGVEFFKALAVNVGENNFFDFFFAEYDFHFGSLLAPRRAAHDRHSTHG
jgi:hypothetical protein